MKCRRSKRHKVCDNALQLEGSTHNGDHQNSCRLQFHVWFDLRNAKIPKEEMPKLKSGIICYARIRRMTKRQIEESTIKAKNSIYACFENIAKGQIQ